MALHAALAAAAALLALAFALSTLERWLDRRKKHELLWTIALFMFALGSIGLWLGASFGWSEWSYKVFYLFGAILNVPFLALGTVYLLWGERAGDWSTALVSLLAAFAAGVVVTLPMIGVLDPTMVTQGKNVFGAPAVILAGVASGVASLVIIGGALWSAWQLWRARHARAIGPGSVSPARLALANVLIAVGVFVTGGGGVLNSVFDAMNAFAISLVAGIAIIFVGFLLTNPPAERAIRADGDVEPWYPVATTPDRAPDSAGGADALDVRGLADVAPGSPHLN